MKDPGNLVTIDLLRHGEVEGGARYCGSTDPKLTDQGWEQLWQAVSLLPDWDYIVSSPLHRCAEFAQVLGVQRKIPFITDSRLSEIDFGDWERKTATELFKAEPDAVTAYWSDPVKNSPPGGEPLERFNNRVIKAYVDLVEQFPQQHLLLVTHAGVMRNILCHALTMPLQSLFRLEVPYACLSRVKVYVDNNGQHTSNLVFHAGRL